MKWLREIGLCLIGTSIFLNAMVAGAETVEDYVSRTCPNMDEMATAVVASMGSMSSWEKLFVDRLARLSPESQRKYATSLALDGRITQEDLAALPVSVRLSDDPTEIMALLAEHARADYWPGFYRRHRLAVNMKLRHWADTAERRYDDPDFCRKLIDIFFQMVDGTYEGPMDLEYFPASRDLYRATD